jgi:hypothetical protein
MGLESRKREVKESLEARFWLVVIRDWMGVEK